MQLKSQKSGFSLFECILGLALVGLWMGLISSSWHFILFLSERLRKESIQAQGGYWLKAEEAAIVNIREDSFVFLPSAWTLNRVGPSNPGYCWVEDAEATPASEGKNR